MWLCSFSTAQQATEGSYFIFNSFKSQQLHDITLTFPETAEPADVTHILRKNVQIY